MKLNRPDLRQCITFPLHALAVKGEVRLVLLACRYVVTVLLGSTSLDRWKACLFPFKWCHVCREHAFVG